MNIYDRGDLVRLTCAFTDAAGAAADPTAVAVTIKAPDDTVTTGAATKSAVGSYYFDLSITQSGVYAYRFAGTGAVQAAAEGQLRVKPSFVLP